MTPLQVCAAPHAATLVSYKTVLQVICAVITLLLLPRPAPAASTVTAAHGRCSLALPRTLCAGERVPSLESVLREFGGRAHIHLVRSCC